MRMLPLIALVMASGAGAQTSRAWDFATRRCCPAANGMSTTQTGPRRLS